MCIRDSVESGLGNNDTNGDGRTDAEVGDNGLDNSATHETADDYTDVSGLGHDGSTFQLADTDGDTEADGSNAAPTETDLDYRDDSAVPVIDLNSAADSNDSDRDFATTFNDNGPPVNVANVNLADASSLGDNDLQQLTICLLYTSPSPRDATLSRMPSSA